LRHVVYLGVALLSKKISTKIVRHRIGVSTHQLDFLNPTDFRLVAQQLSTARDRDAVRFDVDRSRASMLARHPFRNHDLVFRELRAEPSTVVPARCLSGADAGRAADIDPQDSAPLRPWPGSMTCHSIVTSPRRDRDVCRETSRVRCCQATRISETTRGRAQRYVLSNVGRIRRTRKACWRVRERPVVLWERRPNALRMHVSAKRRRCRATPARQRQNTPGETSSTRIRDDVESPPVRKATASSSETFSSLIECGLQLG